MQVPRGQVNKCDEVRCGFGTDAGTPSIGFENRDAARADGLFGFGIGSAVRTSAHLPVETRLRFLSLPTAGPRVPWALNPLIAGSIPTRLTNQSRGWFRKGPARFFFEAGGAAQ